MITGAAAAVQKQQELPVIVSQTADSLVVGSQCHALLVYSAMVEQQVSCNAYLAAS
jgi:hypothetical protein